MVDQTSGPTAVPEADVEADRRAWEDEAVPYDDAFIAAYAEEDDLPPFDMPEAGSAAPGASPAPAAPASRESTSAAQPAPAASAVAPSSSPAPSAQPAPPASPAPAFNAAPFGTADAGEVIPQSSEEQKEMLSNIFGATTVFKMEGGQ